MRSVPRRPVDSSSRRVTGRSPEAGARATSATAPSTAPRAARAGGPARRAHACRGPVRGRVPGRVVRPVAAIIAPLFLVVSLVFAVLPEGSQLVDRGALVGFLELRVEVRGQPGDAVPKKLLRVLQGHASTRQGGSEGDSQRVEVDLPLRRHALDSRGREVAVERRAGGDPLEDEVAGRLALNMPAEPFDRRGRQREPMAPEYKEGRWAGQCRPGPRRSGFARDRIAGATRSGYHRGAGGYEDTMLRTCAPCLLAVLLLFPIASTPADEPAPSTPAPATGDTKKQDPAQAAALRAAVRALLEADEAQREKARATLLQSGSVAVPYLAEALARLDGRWEVVLALLGRLDPARAKALAAAHDPWYLPKLQHAQALIQGGDQLTAIHHLEAILVLEPDCPIRREIQREVIPREGAPDPLEHRERGTRPEEGPGRRHRADHLHARDRERLRGPDPAGAAARSARPSTASCRSKSSRSTAAGRSAAPGRSGT